MNRNTPPTHLVVFKHSTTKGVKVIDSVRRSIGKRVKEPRSTAIEYFAPLEKGLQEERVYPHLGIAALHLDARHVAKFKRHSEVFDVVENHTRHALGSLERSWTAEQVHAALDSGTNDPSRPYAAPNSSVQAFGGGNVHVRPYGTNDPVRPYGSNDPVRPYGGNERVRPYGDDPNWLSGSIGPYLAGRRDEIESILFSLFGSASAGIQDVLPAVPASKDITWSLRRLGIPSENSNGAGEGIRVAVLDSGIDLQHPDFAGRFKPPNRANLANFINREEKPQDGFGHGTHCCGLVAGPRDPKCKIRYGVAPDVTLLVGKVLDDKGDGKDSDILDGIAWASSKGARVISLSLGSQRNVDGQFSPAYAAAARRLLKPPLNCIIVAATGNESQRPLRIAPVSNPAACPWILSVASVDAWGRIADYSCGQRDNIGLVTLSAPGTGVFSSYPGGGYATISGTSMSAAYVAGLAALYQQKNPDWTALNLWPVLTRRALPLGLSKDYGYGLAQAP